MTEPGNDGSRWYWCLTHGTVEPEGGCRGTDRMGPYATPEDATNWRRIAAARNEAWESGEDD